MSICIAIAVPDGIALAADSQITWNQVVTTVREKDTGRDVILEKPLTVPLSWSKMARKLFQVKIADKNYAVCFAGLALLNRKTIYSICRSLEASFPGDGDSTFDGVATYFCDGIAEEMKKQFGVDDLSTLQLGNNVVEFLLAGFDDNDVSKPRIEKWIVFTGTLNGNNTKMKNWTNKNESQYNYGGCWIGRVEFVSHLVTHSNPNLPQIQGQFELLSLSDAVDYTKFLVNFTCDFQRFAAMVPDCGKPIISSTLVPDRYNEEVVSE